MNLNAKKFTNIIKFISILCRKGKERKNKSENKKENSYSQNESAWRKSQDWAYLGSKNFN